MGAIAHFGSPPKLSRHEYLKVCQMANIADENISLDTIDNIFSETFLEDSKDLEKKKISRDKQLIRFEFFEILVRIAHAKYVATGAL